MGHLTTGPSGYPPLPAPPPDNRYHLHQQQSPGGLGPPTYYNGNYTTAVPPTVPNGGLIGPNGGGVGVNHLHGGVVRSLSRQSQVILNLVLLSF